ncbi:MULTISPECIES: mechanosensitive ion channel family protein [unclassified Campylobacter]|uniref:mechanosensitive ion channel family protein n=1 Tax=unclassified Campylobacter TaxID=2593542 RepID=UPI0022E99B6B|nr:MULTISPECIES: mechanosensitive ion channel family protein [unclassified Campylobacter]MDA3080044.1 mechanosensitive ion channel family protein [Campylobacter sp. CS_NA2]MDA3081738.1 mechanosensitive ion channel family protein [Campylobacter sp. CS_NA1]MDA3086101.1 mechanosensitive ion channel family protein [Campylobacter sp. CS_ED1]MDA3090950.1 mechanosensitive ion channel family protein [Campylobacter sp. CS_ED2]WBR51218.1 mechanosensitive ion channel family protein [Campylobacter sp. CS_
MKKFIISFLAIISFIFADVNSSDTNITKEEVIEAISKNSDSNESEVRDLIVEKIEKSENSDSLDSDTIRLSAVVNDIRKLNAIHKALLAKGDTNATGEEAKNLAKSKEALFDTIPYAITKQKINKEGIVKYLEHKNSLLESIEKNKNKQGSKEYIEASFSLENMNLAEIFYGSLLKVDDLFTKGSGSKALEKELQSSILTLQTLDFSNLLLLKEKLKTDEEKLNFDNKFGELENSKQTYEEVLNYLLTNKDLLTSNAIVTRLNLNTAIDYINEKSPKIGKLNVGKTILVLFIIGFFYSLRRFLANLLYFIFKPFSKNQSIDLKTQVVDILKRPLGILLIAYAISICLSIISYPAPLPVKVANALSIAYIILNAWLILVIIDGYGIILLGNLAKKSARKEIVNLMIKILYIFVVIVAILLILRRLGFNISALLASLGIGGLAIALATKDIIANFFTSIMLLFDNSFSQGDYVAINGVEGHVVEIGMRKTTIRTMDNALVSVPNSNIVAQNIINWSRRKIGRHLKIVIGVEYSSPKDKIQKAISEIKDMLEDHPEIAATHDNAKNAKDHRIRHKQKMVSIDDLAGYKNLLYVVLDEFADSSINILIYCYTKTTNFGEFLEVKQDILFKIMEILEQNSLSFAFPSQSLYVEKLPKFEYDNKTENSNNKGAQNG